MKNFLISGLVIYSNDTYIREKDWVKAKDNIEAAGFFEDRMKAKHGKYSLVRDILIEKELPCGERKYDDTFKNHPYIQLSLFE